jgi:hypothetical protein
MLSPSMPDSDDNLGIHALDTVPLFILGMLDNSKTEQIAGLLVDHNLEWGHRDEHRGSATGASPLAEGAFELQTDAWTGREDEGPAGRAPRMWATR